MKTRRKWLTMLAVFASLTLVAAACSSDDPEPAAGPTATEQPTATPAPVEMSETITDIVAGSEDFTTLLAAVQAADLGDTLASEGPFTVFAPTDDAFAGLPEGTLETLLEPQNEDQLAAILTYHVVAAEVMAADVTAGEVETVNGETFEIEVSDMGVVIVDGQGNRANVTQTDITASNGVIHVIDAVLLPA